MCEKEAECVEFFLSPERIGNREKKDCTAQRELNIEILITVLQLINKSPRIQYHCWTKRTGGIGGDDNGGDVFTITQQKANNTKQNLKLNWYIKIEQYNGFYIVQNCSVMLLGGKKGYKRERHTVMGMGPRKIAFRTWALYSLVSCLFLNVFIA